MPSHFAAHKSDVVIHLICVTEKYTFDKNADTERSYTDTQITLSNLYGELTWRQSGGMPIVIGACA